MSYIEPPPKLIKPDDFKKAKLQNALGENGDYHEFRIRKGRISEVREILELINTFAASNLMLARGPQYLYENIRDFAVATRKIDNQKSIISACGSLHVLWEDMAEIRSTAIHADFQKHGLGRRIVDFMKKEAKELGIRKLFTFTLAEDFFKALGFERQDKEQLPLKVWGECSKCPKYFRCDEVGMILEI